MKKKILLAAMAFAAMTTMAIAADKDPSGDGPRSATGSQQVIVNNYSLHGGYEYTSRLKRFHTSYVTFDFYSPMYTEVYWYRYTPYTWGVSIYDDWYYYGGNVSRHSWTSGFGGSYWWGYEPWWGYSSGIGSGWNSWYGGGSSYSVNYYLGRPHYHYPVAYSGWNSYRYGNYSRPRTVINNNTYNYYYGSEKRNSNQGASSGYNPATPYPSGRRAGYSTAGGRSSAGGTTPSSGSGGTRSGTQTGARSGNTQSDSEKDKSNNGLRMGQHRRGVADPPEPGDNGLPRTNNPNVDDRTNPGREQDNASANRRNKAKVTPQGTTGPQTRSTQNSGNRPNSVDQAPARGTQPQKTQGSVKTTTQRRETVMRQGSPSGSTTPTETTAQPKKEKKTENSSESNTSAKESKKTTPPAARRR